MNGPLTGPDPQLQQLITPQGPVPAPNMPQPPQQPGGAPSPPGTLGAVQQQMAPGNPLVEQYIQTVQALEQQLAPLKMPVQPPRPGPGLLESLGTFGLANLKHIADENTRREQNYVAVKNNQAVSLKAAEMAQHMVDAGAVSGMNESRLNLALQRYNTDLQQKLFENYRQTQGDAYKRTAIPAPKTPDEMTTLHAAGYGPSKRWPNAWVPVGSEDEPSGGAPGGGGVSPKLTRDPSGGWVDPNTPVGRALGNVATPGDQPRPGERPEDTAARIIRERKTAEKLSVPTSSTRTMAEMAPKVLDFVSTIEQQLPGITGPAASRWREFKTGRLGLPDRAFAKYRTDVGLLQTALMRMHAGARGSETLVKKFTDMLNSGIQSPENMQGALDAIKDYANDVQKSGGAATTETTTTTTPPTTLRGTAPTAATGVTPSGVRYRVVQ
jgi:hypothetical protein